MFWFEFICIGKLTLKYMLQRVKNHVTANNRMINTFKRQIFTFREGNVHCNIISFSNDLNWFCSYNAHCFFSIRDLKIIDIMCDPSKIWSLIQIVQLQISLHICRVKQELPFLVYERISFMETLADSVSSDQTAGISTMFLNYT